MRLPIFIAALSGFVVSQIQAQQTPDGFTVQERPGLAMVKSQPWAKDKDATVTEFAAFTDRSVKGTPGAGYFEFRTKSGNRTQIPASRVVELLVYPRVEDYPEISTDEDRAAIEKTITSIEALNKRFPSTQSYTSPYVKAIAAELGKYKAGQLKVEGTWVQKIEHQREKADQLAGMLKVEILRAKPLADFDMRNDPRFRALQEMSASDPTLQPLLKSVTDYYDKTARAEKRKALLVQLSDEKLSRESAQELVTTLRGLKPDEDKQSTDFVKAWDISSSRLDGIDVSSREISEAIEMTFENMQTASTPPPLPAKLAGELATLNSQIRDYEANKPPAQLALPKNRVDALAALGADYKALPEQLAAKDLFAAKLSLDKLAAFGTAIGPNTGGTMDNLRKVVTQSIDEFTKLTDEGKQLANSGKPQEALAKYEAAYALVADPDVEKQIESLKSGAQ